MKLAILGGGWAGLACAVYARQAGHAVTLQEAARTLGGRARRVELDGLVLDNGQHILIGAYRDTLALLRTVGVDPGQALRRLPLSLRFADGRGLAAPAGWPPPLDLAAAILGARGWTPADKAGLLRLALRWRCSGFECPPQATVATLCAPLTPRVREQLIDLLCVAALNTPPERASGAVFLRVLRDALFGERGGADLLLPRADLGTLLPDAAAGWLAARGASLQLGRRAGQLQPLAEGGWQVDGERFDAVVLACAAPEAARLARHSGLPTAEAWAAGTEGLQYEGIATLYARDPRGRPLPAPIVALASGRQAPAQFAFDRGQLGGPPGLLALVASACDAPAEDLQRQMLAQAAAQLGRPELVPLRTLVEKRATFSCTPMLARPGAIVAPGLLACGDYVAGPYPATLEGAVRSARVAANQLGCATRP